MIRAAEQHSLRGNLPRGSLTSGPPHTHDASKLSSNTTQLTHSGAASRVTWNNNELPNSHAALPAILYQMELFALNKVSFFPTPQL